VLTVSRIHDALTQAGCTSRDQRNWTCPAHEDANPSLSVGVAGDGKILLNCHAGCTFDAIAAALDLGPGELAGDRDDEWTPAGPAVATYRYHDHRGELVMGVSRTADKQFRQWRPDPAKPRGRAWSVRGVKLVPYRLPEVLAAVEDGRPVFVVEGEKDADAIVRAGAVATCNPGGALKWRKTYARWFEGADVVVVADRDAPGRAHAEQVAESLQGVAASVRIAEAAEGKDAADHLAAGHALDELVPPRWVEGTSGISGVVEGSTSLGDDPRAELRQGAAAEPVDLVALLHDVEAFLRRYLVFTSDAQSCTVALYVAHTWAFHAFEVTPYLHVRSAEKRSGKTTLLELLRLLCRFPLLQASCTAAALFRSIDEVEPPTILFDEVQDLFVKGADESQRELRALLHAGYRVGGNVRRCVGEGAGLGVADFPVFSPKVLAGVGDLPDMLADRSIPIQLKRKPKGAKVERFRRRDADAAAQDLVRRLGLWGYGSAAVIEDLRARRPALPEALNDRQQDTAEPLLAIAEAAGGAWPDRARAAVVELHAAATPQDSAGVLLLRHVRDEFTLSGEVGDDGARTPFEKPLDRLTTARLLVLLCERDDGPWPVWWGEAVAAGNFRGPASRLAKLLKPYDIEPKQLRLGDSNERGYERAAFEESWGLYCTEDATDATPQVRPPIHDATGGVPVASSKRPLSRDVASVASSNGEGGAEAVFVGAATATQRGFIDLEDYRDRRHWK
jgi:5S rRNA maturation endonuclease (ribonuclease M5)